MDRFPRSDRRPSSIIGQTDMHWNGRTDRDKDIAKDHILLGIVWLKTQALEDPEHISGNNSLRSGVLQQQRHELLIVIQPETTNFLLLIKL